MQNTLDLILLFVIIICLMTELPPAIAILNPKQKDCNYPYKELCGCGVGFKLITALSQRLDYRRRLFMLS